MVRGLTKCEVVKTPPGGGQNRPPLPGGLGQKGCLNHNNAMRYG
jgi:hypothetical protein